MHVTLRQPGAGKTVGLKVGFSWYFLLLTPIYGLALFLKELWGHGLLVFLLGIIAVSVQGSDLTPFAGLLLIAAAVLYALRGNRLVRLRSNCMEKGEIRAH
ncbi:hypothetical protein [Sphingosinithalassobacter portus]|uniref:hypothetical protein n=1 Tax=Stakelama portus TaxID=2676234 RepID=UPI000D6E8DC0|nr:hypothetical protein [Sphingosinithalassobacter portus]